MNLNCRHISYFYGSKKGIEDIDLDFEPGVFYGILGPNGSGKSTLLRLLAGLLQPQQGAVTAGGKLLSAFTPKEAAACISFVPQSVRCSFPYSCSEVVGFGLYARSGAVSPGESEERVKSAMALTGISELSSRSVLDVSGGEFQRVMLAQSLAQGAEILILDEPLSYLDVAGQREIIGLLKRLSREKTVIISIHDLTLAAFYCDMLVFLKQGKLCGSGKSASVMTQELLKEVFGVEALLLDYEGPLPPVVRPGR